MRLFYAALPPDEAISVLAQAQNSFKLPQVRIVPRRNLHITLHFLGDVSEDECALLLTEVKKLAPVKTRVCFDGSIYGFPHSNRWKVAAAGINDQTGVLRHLHSILSKGTDKRSYKPHITIARSSVEQHTLPALGIPNFSFDIEGFHLMESTLHPQGPLYRSICHF